MTRVPLQRGAGAMPGADAVATRVSGGHPLVRRQRLLGNRQVTLELAASPQVVRRLPWRRSARVLFSAVRAATTPNPMPDRIPPRDDLPTGVPMTVGGRVGAAAPLTVSIDGNGTDAGTAQVNGRVEAQLAATSQLLAVTGVTSTAAGRGGRLRLEARQGGRLIGRSAGFSVAAIPLDYTCAPFQARNGPNWYGLVVRTGWRSDSGSLAHLQEIRKRERIEVTRRTGAFADHPPALGAGDWGPGDRTGTDTHTIAADWIKQRRSDGRLVLQQTFEFDDRRTGATNVPMPRSGFRVVHVLTVPRRGGYRLETGKAGRTGRALGVFSEAGATTADIYAEQAIGGEEKRSTWQEALGLQ